MNRQPIESRMLHSFAYDAEREILELQFRNKDGSGGKVYQYQNVGAVAAKDFAEATSHGKHYLQFIKPANYPFQRIEESSEDAQTQATRSAEADAQATGSEASEKY